MVERSWLSVFALVVAVGLVTAVALYVGIIPNGTTATAASGCENGTAVPDPANNAGLVADCEALLAVKDTLRGSASLDWDVSTAVKRWRGVYVWENLREPERVRAIFLSGRKLDGTIPPAIGGLSELLFLELHKNALTGPIPAELFDLSKLQGLRLQDNKLTGSIPAELADLSLRYLTLHDNRFSGCIPAELPRRIYPSLQACGSTTTTPTATATPKPATTYTLTATQPQNGSLAVEPAAASYASGTAVTVTATAATGYALTAWGGACAGTAATSATCTLTMDADKTVSATFGKTSTATYTLTLTTPEHGTLTASPAGGSHAAGTAVTVTATAATGYALTAWGGGCAATPATSATCELTMDADKTVSATFGKAGPGIAQAPAPELLAVVTGKAGEVLLEWRVASAPAGLTGWQYRYLKVSYEGVRGAWGRWTAVPGGASARSHRVTGLPDRRHLFEVRAVAGSRTGRASASVEGAPAWMGADGIPSILPGDIIEGGRTWRLHEGRTVFDVPAGTRLVGGGVALDSGRVIVSFRDLISGTVQVVDIGRAEGVARRAPPAAPGDALTAGSGDSDRDVDAIFDKIMASARLVPAK